MKKFCFDARLKQGCRFSVYREFILNSWSGIEKQREANDVHPTAGVEDELWKCSGGLVYSSKRPLSYMYARDCHVQLTSW